MKLREWAEQQGVSWRTAHRRFHRGEIPGAFQTSSGRIYVEVDADDCDGSCVSDLHLKCLIEKMTSADVDQLAQRFAEAGYVIERRPQD
ncbi:hypothetical protein BBK82_03525 [Lentzea guizhouensis]|uniref:Uncharacterized protein n=1 Tax=Lentzea guizhouensis TaxID=1586287 RepID=A0A1B2HC73_9PSEU|nr:hypothetical protein [Lentzea guizhouensis]ANZ35286.1 hypothetical protein BBK82_03525 [Lentzea guizhouensis]